jgi:hypothetical protein
VVRREKVVERVVESVWLVYRGEESHGRNNEEGERRVDRETCEAQRAVMFVFVIQRGTWRKVRRVEGRRHRDKPIGGDIYMIYTSCSLLI